MPRAALFVLVVLLVAFPAPSARASDVGDFHAAVAGATRHYRDAQFYLRTDNAGVAALELQSLAEKWAALVDRFGQAPPDTYAGDTRWGRDLGRIADRIRAGREAAEAGDAKAARKAIRPIRRALSDLRARNGVFVFSDCVDRADAAMDALYRFRRKPPDFDDPAAVDAAREATAVTAHWYRTCLETAPAAYREDPQFARIMESSLNSLAKIWPALRDGDRRRFVNILRELHSWNELLYLRFG